jgi:flagellar assembly protein FliH
VADARIVRGGCVVEGRERIIDGRVDLALEQIFRKLSGTDA